MHKLGTVAALFGLLVLGVVLAPMEEQLAEPEARRGTTRGSAIDPVTTSASPLPRHSFAEAAALKAVDEYTAAGIVAASAGTRVDPMFRSCRDASIRGYGPYQRGSHVEYYWYRDGEMDGTTCEIR